jgi:hypothetical protein
VGFWEGRAGQSPDRRNGMWHRHRRARSDAPCQIPVDAPPLPGRRTTQEGRPGQKPLTPPCSALNSGHETRRNQAEPHFRPLLLNHLLGIIDYMRAAAKLVVHLILLIAGYAALLSGQPPLPLIGIGLIAISIYFLKPRLSPLPILTGFFLALALIYDPSAVMGHGKDLIVWLVITLAQAVRVFVVCLSDPPSNNSTNDA